MAVSLAPIGSAGIYNPEEFASSLGVGAGSAMGNPAAYGSVPAPVNPQQQQATTIAGNLSNVGQLYNLATGAGAASGAGQATNLNTALPGATAALGTELGLANTELAGQIDQPTINNLEQVAAERGVATGDIGSPNSNAALMQALGRTTQGTEQLGVSNLSSAIGSAPVGPAFNPSSQLLTPAQQLEQANYNSTLAAAPNPQAAAMANLAALSGSAGGGGFTGIGGGIPMGSTSTSGSSYPAGAIITGQGGAGAPLADGGAGAYQEAYGQALPEGMTFDSTTGMLVDESNGTETDPNTGLTYDADTGEVIGIGGQGEGDEAQPDNEYSYYE